MSRNSLCRLHQRFFCVFKVRKAVLIFKRSPTSNDDVLQQYVKAEFGKELSLLLDSKTRWSSLWVMLERFQQLKDCVLKSLMDMKNPLTFSANEFQQISQLVSGLEPVKVTVEALCRADANLLTAEIALKFLMDTLHAQETSSPLAKELVAALRHRILQRRCPHLSGVLAYLHNPMVVVSENECDVDSADSEIFDIPSSAKIRKTISECVTRLMAHNNEKTAAVAASSAVTVNESTSGGINAASGASERSGSAEQAAGVSVTTVIHMSVAQKLQQVLTTSVTEIYKPPLNSNLTVASKNAMVKKEMSLFEGGGTRGMYMQMAYNSLLTIPPSSVESERAFSAAGILCSRLRTRMSDKVLDDILFMRSYFKSIKKSSK